MSRPLIVLGVLLLVSSGGALAHSGDDHGDAAHQSFVGTAEVAPGDIAELNFEAEEGAAIAYSVKSSVPVDVDIHEHTPGIVFHAQHNETRSAVDSFVVPHNGSFSLMVAAPRGGEAADVDLVLEGVFAVVGETAFVTTEAPAMPAVVAVVLGVALLALVRRGP